MKIVKIVVDPSCVGRGVRKEKRRGEERRGEEKRREERKRERECVREREREGGKREIRRDKSRI